MKQYAENAQEYLLTSIISPFGLISLALPLRIHNEMYTKRSYTLLASIKHLIKQHTQRAMLQYHITLNSYGSVNNITLQFFLFSQKMMTILHKTTTLLLSEGLKKGVKP